MEGDGGCGWGIEGWGGREGGGRAVEGLADRLRKGFVDRVLACFFLWRTHGWDISFCDLALLEWAVRCPSCDLRD